jgi:hypothetical protein
MPKSALRQCGDGVRAECGRNVEGIGSGASRADCLETGHSSSRKSLVGRDGGGRNTESACDRRDGRQTQPSAAAALIQSAMEGGAAKGTIAGWKLCQDAPALPVLRRRHQPQERVVAARPLPGAAASRTP